MRPALKRAFDSIRPAPSHLEEAARRSHERYRYITLSAVAGTVSKLVAAAAGLLTVPMAVGYVGKDLFGLWMVVSSLVVWMQLAEFGVANGLSNALSEAHGRDDVAAASTSLSSALAATTVIAAGLLPILWGLALGVDWASLLKLERPDWSAMASQALLVVGCAFAINIPASLASRVYVAYQRGYIPSAAQMLASVAMVGALWAAIRLDLGLMWLVAITAFVPVFANVLLWFGIRHLRPGLEVRPARVGRVGLARVAESSVPLFLFQMGALLVNQFVNLVIARIGNLAMVADYNLVMRVYLLAFTAAAALSSPFYPAMREALERRETAWVARAIRHSLALRLVATAPFVLAIVPMGDWLVSWWVGRGTAQSLGVWGWACVGLCLCMATLSSLLSEILSSFDEIWAQVGIVFVSAVIVISLLYVLVPINGVSGVFLAMAASTVLSVAWSGRRLHRMLSST
jgi:O-antigen/teichoic acid export membrane protein